MNEAKLFYLDEYLISLGKLKRNEQIDITKDKKQRYKDVCDAIIKYFTNEWDKEQKTHGAESSLERQKRAIIGYTNEVSFYKDKISEYLKQNNLFDLWYPEWYPNLVEAIFHDNWGIAGIYEWLYSDDPKLKYSSSAKIIGEKIYFLIDGKQVLQKQTISKERRERLKRALILSDPKKRINDKYTEVFMLDGTRITIYGDNITARQDVIIFRKFFVEEMSFDEQARRNTIPEESIPLFRTMIKLGFNVAILGQVRSAKTTFLQTWQSYEDPSLEGLLIETSPEIPIHTLMPTAPIVRLIIDDEDELNNLIKPLMRSDADYLMLGEARNGIDLNLAVKIANKGTRRIKMTFHTTDPRDFPYDVAREIYQIYSGDEEYHAIKTAKAFQFLFHFSQLKDKSQKRLIGIYEVYYNHENRGISVDQICKYDFIKDSWLWVYKINDTIESIGNEEDPFELNLFKNQLKYLADKYPLKG